MCRLPMSPYQYQLVTEASTPDYYFHGDGFQFGPMLERGMAVDVRWPDGTESRHTVQTRGVTDNRSEAYVTVSYRGVAGEIPMRGLQARLARPEKRRFDSRGFLMVDKESV